MTNPLTIAETLRRDHFECEEPWYSCPKHEGYTGFNKGKTCTCGADKQNEQVERLIGLLRCKHCGYPLSGNMDLCRNCDGWNGD